MKLDIAKIPIEVKQISTILESKGYPAYIVGGCVRDTVIGRTPKDWDICTPATPDLVTAAMEQSGYKVIPTGIKHGTVTVLVNDGQYEITTFRIDGDYKDNRHPENVEFTTDIVEDLKRRDFTMNAMACRINGDGEIIDPFHGIDDLRARLVRCVGNPYERFREDGLRILRALRFASTYLLNIDPSTKNGMYEERDLLRKISQERITSEFCKMLMGPDARLVLLGWRWIMLIIIPEILPMIAYDQRNPYHQYSLWRHTTFAATDFTEDYSLEVRLALLFHDIGKVDAMVEDPDGIRHYPKHAVYSADHATKIMERMRFPRDTIDLVKTLILYHDGQIQPTEKSIKRYLNKIGEKALRLLLQVQACDKRAQREDYDMQYVKDLKACDALITQVIEKGACFSMKDLKINGDVIISLGINEGRMIGTVLKDLLQKVIDGELKNESEDLIDYVKRNYIH